MILKRCFVFMLAALFALFAVCACSSLKDLCGGAKEPKRIVIYGGESVHGYSFHENELSAELTAEALKEALGDCVNIEVVTGKLPDNLEFYKGAAALVVYGEGEKHHPFYGNEKLLDEISKAGTSIALFHYATMFDGFDHMDILKNVSGAAYEIYYSVNPKWFADVYPASKHQILNGVKPFKIYDEWYFNYRFRPEGVEPLIEAVPTDEVYNRGDGRHAGNKFMRAARGKPQVLAWACVNPNGTRGFGFGGWHYIFNFNCDSFRKLIVNAIAWTAGFDVPKDGYSTSRPDLDSIDKRIKNKKRPADFDRNMADWRNKSIEWNK